jgi:hypothetical protein
MSLGNITIGSQFTTNSIGNFILQQNYLKTSSASLATYLFDNLTSATCYICNSMSSGSILIGTLMNSSGIITIGSGFSTINVGNFKFTGSLGIDGYSATDTFSLLSNLTTGFLNIGNNLTTGGVRIYKPLYLGYTALTTPASNQMGYSITYSPANVSVPTANVPTLIHTFTLPVGVWLCYATSVPNTAGTSYWAMGLTKTISPLTIDPTMLNSTLLTRFVQCQVTGVITSTSASANYGVFAQCGIVNTAGTIRLTTVRIA